MDEDFMLWAFLEEERERLSGSGSVSGGEDEYVEEDDDEDEEDEELMERIGLGLLRRGGNS